MIRKAEEIDWSDTQYLIENQKNINWGSYFYSHPPKEQVVQLMEKCVSNKEFWGNILLDPKYLLNDLDLLIKYQDKVDWEWVFGYDLLTDEQIKKLMSAIHNEDFELNLPYNYWSKEKLIKYQNEVYWDEYFDIYPDQEEVKELMSVIKDERFWSYLPYKHYTVNMLIKKQHDIDWYDYLHNNGFDGDFSRIEKLMFSITDKDFWDNIPSEWLYDLEFDEINKIAKYIVKPIDITQIKCLNTNDEDLNKKRLDILIRKSPAIASNFAKDIATDFTQITNKDKIGDFFTIGNNNLHNQRVGVFVLFKINNDIHFIAKRGSEHSRMLMDYIKTNNLTKKYPVEDISKLFNVEANNEKIDKKFDLQQEKKLEHEYNKEDIHSCFGYIHVDEDGNNPIAIMDNDRTYNFSPQQVAEIIKTQKFDGKPFIAVGIANSSTSNTSFMKVATKKRLNKTLDYTILYRFDNVILNRLLKYKRLLLASKNNYIR